MRKLMILLVACFSLGSFSAVAQSEDQTMQKESETEERQLDEKYDDVDKNEIGPRQLPEEARRDIMDNYHNAEILRVFQLNYGEDRQGYLVEVQKGPKVWTIEYDKDGDPVNKINPIKM